MKERKAKKAAERVERGAAAQKLSSNSRSGSKKKVRDSSWESKKKPSPKRTKAGVKLAKTLSA